MRKITAILLAAVMALALGACDNPADHERILNEIAEKNRAYNEKRQAFLASDVYATAYDYVEQTLQELLPGCKAFFSIEPKSLIDNDLTAFADFAENDQTKRAFFSQTQVYITVNFWDYDTDAQAFAEQLMARAISGNLAADEFGEDCWTMDAVKDKAQFVPKPEV